MVMTDLTGVPPVSTAFAGPMSLTPPSVSEQVYDDVKLLIEGLNQHAGRGRGRGRGGGGVRGITCRTAV